MNRNRRKTLAAAVGAVVLLLVSACGGASSSSSGEWTGYSYLSTGLQLDVLKELGEETIPDVTDDELKISVHPGGSLGIDAAGITQAVGQGSIQFADDGFYYGSVPIAGLLMLPMLYQSPEDIEAAWDDVQPLLQEDMNEINVEVLAHYQYPMQTFFTNEPVTKLADLSGLSIRTSSPQQQAFVEALGGSPVTIGTAEVPTALEQGVVDGAMTASSGAGRIWKDSLTHNYRLESTPFVSIIMVNQKDFQSLSEETQTAVRNAAEQTASDLTAQMAQEEREVSDQLESEGMVVTEASSQDIEKATSLIEDYWGNWASSEGSEALDLLASIEKRRGQ